MSKAPLLAAALLVAAAATPAAAQISRTGVFAQTGQNPNGAYNDLAYNDKDGVYLHVWGHPIVYGRFVNAAGAAIGAGQFIIANHSPAGSDALPRVAYSKGSASDNVFLVTYTSEIPRGQNVYGRLVTYTAAGPVMGAPFLIASPLVTRQIAGGLVFNPARREFVVTWEDFRNGAPDIFFRTVSSLGVNVSAEINITAGPEGQGTPNVAFDPNHGKYLIVYRGGHDGVVGSWGKLVDAATLAFGNPIEISRGGEPAEQNAAYLPEVDRFVTIWTEITRVRDLLGRVIDHNGADVSGIIPIMATASNEGAGDLEYSPDTRSVLVVSMRDVTRYAQGAEITGAGVLMNNYFQATSVVPVGLESLYPQVAAGGSGRFGVGYINGFIDGWFDLLAGTSACSVTLDSTSTTANITGGSGSVVITATNPANCAWTASSNASWLQIASAAGVGPGTINFQTLPNTGTTVRSGSITVLGQTFTVTQCAAAAFGALAPAAAVGGAGGAPAAIDMAIVGSGCGWTATSDSSWLHGTSGTGTSVNYTVDANTSTRARIGRLSVGSQTYTVFQNGGAGIDERIAIGMESFGPLGGWVAMHGGSGHGFEPQSWARLDWDEYNKARGGTRPAVGNLDGDPEDEVVVGVSRGGEGWFFILDDAATGFVERQEIQLPWGYYNQLNGELYPAVGDIDGDGRDEIVVGLGPGGAGWFAIYGDVTPLDGVLNYILIGWRRINWGHYIAAGDGATHPAVGDVDGDGKAEIIVGLGTGGAGWIEIFSDADGLFAHERWLRSSWTNYNMFGSGALRVAAGDIDGDSAAEIVLGFGSGGAGWLEVLNDQSAGFAVIRWLRVNWGGYNVNDGQTHPAIGNLDGDAAGEIVVGLGGAGAGWLQLFDGTGADLGWTRVAVPEFQGAQKATYPAVGRVR